MAARMADDHERGLMPGLGWPLVIVGCGALVWRRSHPVVVVIVTAAASAVYYPVTEPDGPMMIVFVVALYTAAAQGHLIVASVIGSAAMAAVAYGEIRSDVNHLADAGLYLLAGWFVAVIAIGAVVHNRHAYLREAELRAVAAERGREQEALRRTTEERLRIARELHDVLGHNISLINVQANAALYGKDPARAAEALTAIKETSKETLRELRTTLGVLRQVDEAAPVVPPPGLDRLEELTSRPVGPAVRTEIEGDPRPLPPEADLAAFRIVQEALTNVTKHSGATTVTVRIRYTAAAVHVQIDDDGRAEPDSQPGNGIRGMTERAEALGGTLTAHPRPEGGFRVEARIPLPG
ncbi:sensor histidine kinase [Actinomadura rudentiformis]|uniref:histidine kinase n=2 Tax=Actinomadura rudentiformis TaxID=359158 RepID=A0A6H9YL56_9ACTN|nr:sensor histidine kinase [Actinomadura rudentiformis]